MPGTTPIAPRLPEPTPVTMQPPAATAAPGEEKGVAAEKARLIVAYEAEAARLRRALATREARIGQLEAFAQDRVCLYRELADARADTARYRQIVVDLENDAPPPILGERGTPDDLKLIVGIGPVLERMLQQLGIATYRQIARWSERDIDEMDARLPEFPGRIRRDAWVVQARALHQSKYGESA
jgi:predicted flap endonuclease-1-like 5' DNA nuclease